MLDEGRTDLLTGFKSSRTGRNFKAFLVKQKDGSIGFEFEKKEPKPGKDGAAAKTAAAKAEGVAEDDDTTVVATRTVARKTATKTAAEDSGQIRRKAGSEDRREQDRCKESIEGDRVD